MAFVAPLSSTTFTRSQLGSTTSKCVVSHKRPTPAHIRMAFSSIDDPGSACSLFEPSVENKDDVITAAYKQVFGNAYLMESERAELAVAESDFRKSTITVRGLVRAMAKSEAYRKRFFARSGPYRFVELNCKHLLGRGPLDQAEVSMHVQKVVNEGYDAEIDSYMDCEEYMSNFGEEMVPRFVFKGMYPRNDHFNRLTIMRQFWDGCSTSTVSGSTAPGKPIPAQLTMGWGGYVNGFVGVMKGLPAGFRPEPEGEQKLPPVPANAQAPLRVRIKVAENSYQVFEVPAQMPRFEPAWKKELAGEKRLNGVWY